MDELLPFDDDRAYIQAELTRHANGVVDTFTGGINAGRRLNVVRERLPADQDFGAWCKAARFTRPDGKTFTRQWLWVLMGAADQYDYLAVSSDLTPLPTTGLEKLHKAGRDRHARDITSGDQPDQPALIGAHRIIPGDFRDADIDPGTVDLIITDPPYPADSLPLWSDLARLAARWLKPQGIMVALTGKIMLPDVVGRVGEHLQYGWVYCQPLPGSSSRIMARHVAQTWKPWLAYSNGAWPSGRIDWHPDTLEPTPRQKDVYWWQQQDGPACILIDRLSRPGDTVLDPFAGAGTYPAAAARMGRHVIAIEADHARFTALAGVIGA